MAAKKIKTEQETKAPETPAPESQAGQEPGAGQAGDNAEGGEGAGQNPSAEDGEGAGQDPSAEDGEGTGQDPETETGEDAPEKPLPKVLTALRPILYLARQYKAGDSLPVNNPEMVEAWIAAGSAEWREKKGGRFFP